MQIQSKAYPYYREIGERVLELIAPPDTSETRLEVHCRPESIGMFVETVVEQDLVGVVAAIPVDKLVTEQGDGERILRQTIQARLPSFELHRSTRDDIARVSAAINFEGLWPQVKHVIESAKQANEYFEFSKRQQIEQQIEQREVLWQQLGFNQSLNVAKASPASSLSRASVAELTSVLTWLQNSAVPIVEGARGIPQYMVPSSIRSEVNQRLRELTGHSDSEKIEMVHDLALNVRNSLSLAQSVTQT